MADIDEVDNLINGGLQLALKALKLYFRLGVPKYQKISKYLVVFSFHDASNYTQNSPYSKKVSTTEL